MLTIKELLEVSSKGIISFPFDGDKRSIKGIVDKGFTVAG